MLTFRRPEELRRSLPLIIDQVDQVNANSSGHTVADVLVVDNDPAATARQTADAFAFRNVRYVVEARPGISAARNRALEESRTRDLLVFIDDDEQPQEGWLESLIATWRDTDAAAVMGRVVSVFLTEPDPWVAAGDFFERPRMATGTEISVAATGNLLLDLRQVRATGTRFSDHVGLSAGEDILFSRQLARSGGRLVWCDESVADDFVPPDRLTRQWLLGRAWSHGNTICRIDVFMATGAPGRAVARAKVACRGVVRTAAGFSRYALGLMTHSYRHQARGLRTAWRGMGMISGALGLIYREYARDVTGRALNRRLSRRP